MQAQSASVKGMDRASTRPVHVGKDIEEALYDNRLSAGPGDGIISGVRLSIMRPLLILVFGLASILSPAVSFAQQASFRVLAFYTAKGEPDHIAFAEQALPFFAEAAKRNNFYFEPTTRWEDLNAEKLKGFQLVLWLNDFPTKAEQRGAFQEFMEHGGAWLGFHVSGYNDEDTRWPWFVDFLGGGVFYGNNWPPLPAKLIVDDRSHPVTRHLRETLMSPANEWYIWKPSPRVNKDVKVLLTLDPKNYPIGLKDTITRGDLPVVWTNTRYRMIYMNMGHGEKIFDSDEQNRLFEDAVLWLGKRK
jgi:type 1 glutamine amidotransferase